MLPGNMALREEPKEARFEVMRIDHLRLRARLIRATKGLESIRSMTRPDTLIGKTARQTLAALEDDELCAIRADE